MGEIINLLFYLITDTGLLTARMPRRAKAMTSDINPINGFFSFLKGMAIGVFMNRIDTYKLKLLVLIVSYVNTKSRKVTIRPRLNAT